MKRRAGEREHRESWPNLRRLMLSVGFLILAFATLIAWVRPATGYELSIYAATPRSYWISIGIALGVSGLVCAINPRDRLALYGLVLGGFSILNIASLPIIRDYAFLGAADAITHLGYAEDIRSGFMSPTELLYPGGHSAAILFSEAFGIPLQRGLLVWTAIMLIVYMLFIPLFARAIVNHPSVTIVAGFTGLLLLPFNNVSTVYQFHTYSLGVMMLPLFAFALVRYLQSGSEDNGFFRVFDSWSLLLIGVGITMLFLHPQVMLNLLILLGTFAAVHVMSRRRYTDHPLSYLRSTTSAFLVLTVAWFAWSFQHWQPFAAFENLLAAVYFTILGEQEAGQVAADAGVSTTEIGGSLTELFLKLFGVSMAYTLIALIVVIAAVLATFRYRYREDYSVITYVGIGGVVLGPFFMLHFLGDVSTYFFRHLGFAMVFSSAVGAIGVFYIAEAIAGRGGSPSLRVIGLWLLAAVIILSVPVMYSSPYIFLPSAHLTHGEVSGHDTAFDLADGEVGWSGPGVGPGRFYDGLRPGDRPLTAMGHAVYDSENLSALAAGDTDDPVYFSYSDRDYQREVVAYRQLNFDADIFDEIHRERQTNHVYSNGDFEWYYIRPG